MNGLGSYGQSGWHGFWGVLLGLMTIAILAWVAARAFGSLCRRTSRTAC